MNDDSPLKHLQDNGWYDNENSIWIATKLTIRRNLKNHSFPHKLDPPFLAKLTTLLQQPLLNCSGLKKPQFYEAKDLPPNQKQFFYEYYLSHRDFIQMQNGEGLVIDESNTFLASINIEDHLQISIIDNQGEIEKAWMRLLKIENEISEQIGFAFSSKFGFLTSDFHHCGTALNLTSFLHLPTLIHLDELRTLKGDLKKQNMKINSLSGDATNFLGGIVLIQNKNTIAVSEENLLKSMRNATIRLILAEKNARKKLLDNKDSSIKDKISKAFGVLKHSFQLETHETLQNLSLCKLGLEFDWLEGISVKEINKLIFTIRKGHLAQANFSLSGEEIKRERAQIIKNTFENVSLH